LRIGHPSGVIECDAQAEEKEGGIIYKRLAYERTARRIMEGTAYVKNEK
jgi:2-methylaconitate cis-trans-isomerase PrpF